MFTLTIFILIILFLSIMVHEIAHGSVALWLGDTTAKNAGRLTLNPLKHLDPFGSIILPFILLISQLGLPPESRVIFGWAKPVPVNPYNFRDQKWGALKVAIAGPAMNFAIGLFFGLLIRFINLPQSFYIPFSIITVYNFLWGLFNLIPIPPLDGSHILFSFLPQSWSAFKNFMYQYGLIILVLFIFLGMGFLFDWAISISSLITAGKI